MRWNAFLGFITGVKIRFLVAIAVAGT